MKKTLVALAALAVVGAASAQSSYTIYGTVDATLQFGNGDVKNLTALGNSGLNSSEIGFRGIEDLGGGLKAGFILAGGVNNDNGTGASTNTNNQASGASASGGFVFNRRSYLRLMGNFGELRVGRDYTPAFWQEAVYDPMGINGVGTSRAFQGGAAYSGVTAVRASNSIGYLSPSMSGFGVWVQGYLGENASNNTNNDAGTGASVRFTYDNGPLSLGAAFASTNSGPGVDNQVSTLGGTYDLKVAKINAYVLKNQMTNKHDIDGYLIGGTMPMGPGLIRASYSNTDSGAGAVGQFALSYVYSLSKTAQIYGTFANVSNSNGAAAALNGAATSVNGSSSGFDFGISKSF